MSKRAIAAATTAAVLAVPAAAFASPHQSAGHRSAAAAHSGAGKAPRKAKPAHKVAFIFRGTFTAPGTLTVTLGNAQVRKGGFIGKTVTFDLSGARIVGADTNGDQAVDLRDVTDGDLVLVQARLPRHTAYTAPTAADSAAAIVASRLVDQTDQATGD